MQTSSLPAKATSSTKNAPVLKPVGAPLATQLPQLNGHRANIAQAARPTQATPFAAFAPKVPPKLASGVQQNSSGPAKTPSAPTVLGKMQIAPAHPQAQPAPRLPPLAETSELRKHAEGIMAPEPTQLTQNVPAQPKKRSDEEEFLSMTQDRAEVLDHNARLFFELDPQGKGMNLHSFYSSYQEYLEELNLVDPDQYEKKKERAAAEQNAAKESAAAPGGSAANGGVVDPGVPKPVNLDEENISGPEDYSEASNVAGGHRFENLIKSMMARIELNNSLAPIQQYGRHQRKANNRKKGQAPKKKQQNEGAAGAEDGQTTAEGGAVGNSGEKQEVHYDEKFYDLDDGWICDDDVALNDDGVDNFVNESDSHSVIGSSVVNDEEQRMQRLERKEMERIAKRFRVITPAEFERNLSKADEAAGPDRNTRMATDSWGGAGSGAGGQTGLSNGAGMQGVINENGDGMSLEIPKQSNPLATSAANQGSANAKSNTKKRTHDEAFNTQTTEPSIDEVLNNLKQRVLMGESLNNFKRDISQLIDLIEKKDKEFDKLADQVGVKLAGLLQKSQQEMIFMLKRHYLLNKKNKTKMELEKLVTCIKHHIENLLKKCNRKSESAPIELDSLKPDFSLKLNQEVRNMISNFKNVVQDYVKQHNDYCRMKINEEKAKVKKTRLNEDKLDQQLKSKYEEISFESEMTRICLDLVKSCPLEIQPILQRNHLNLLLGLRVEQADKPKLGELWNQVSFFPNTGFSQGRRSGTNAGSQGSLNFAAAVPTQQMQAQATQQKANN